MWFHVLSLEDPADTQTSPKVITVSTDNVDWWALPSNNWRPYEAMDALVMFSVLSASNQIKVLLGRLRRKSSVYKFVECLHLVHKRNSLCHSVIAKLKMKLNLWQMSWANVTHEHNLNRTIQTWLHSGILLSVWWTLLQTDVFWVHGHETISNSGWLLLSLTCIYFLKLVSIQKCLIFWLI